ncbi:flagellin [Campylobacter jejuni]|uniref:flagellin n=1 Tax=Campylobacter jejuni TaxID=197 RepID=UPI00333E546E
MFLKGFKMGFRINTNVAALNAKANADLNSKSLDASLSRLSSGLRINSAADDASGMAIADSLRSQANTLGQAISNGNDALGILQTAMDIAETAITNLDQIRADIGSVQNQVTSTINNITVTQVNVKAAESQIRDVDFAAESANYSKANILAQSGSYAMAQANSVQQNVLRLLQ